MMFAYGMRLRGRAPSCQPKGYVDWQDFDERTKLSTGEEVWSILWYRNELSNDEVYEYELVRLEAMDK